jgi:hypothetical protein
MTTSRKKKAQKQYRVIWEIDIWAKSPTAAAKEARKIQQDVMSTASFFTVRSMRWNGKDILVELPVPAPRWLKKLREG